MLIKNSTFEENHSKFKSNCIYFIGENFSIYDSFFGNNYPAYDYYDLNPDFPYDKSFPYQAHEENAGAIFSSAHYMLMNSCYFFNNSNMNGGGIFLNKHSQSDSQYFLIEETIFHKNQAGESGASLYLAEDIGKIIGNIIKCVFLKNYSYYGIIFNNLFRIKIIF